MTSREEWLARVAAEAEGRSVEDLLSSPLPEGFRRPALPEPGGEDPSLPGEWPYARGGLPGRPARNMPRVDLTDPAAFRDAVRQDLHGGADALWFVGDAARTEPLDVVSALAQVPAEDLLVAVELGSPSAAFARAVERDRPGTRALVFTDPCADGVPHDLPFAVNARAWHGAGAHAVLELAYAAAAGVHALRLLEKHGVDPATGASRLGFSVSVGRDVLVEIAKLRALRMIWAKVTAAAGVDATPPWIHAASSVRRLPRRGAWNNLVRATTHAFAAICGGADAVTAAPFDAAAGAPSRAARRTARNTVTLLRDECALADVADPGAGAPAIEWLTDRLARAAWERFRAIEGRGGMMACLLSGEIRRELETAAASRKDEPWVGVTEAVDPDEAPDAAGTEARR